MKNHTIKSKSGRLELRPFRTEDFDAIHAILSNPRVMEFSLKGPYTEEDTRNFLERMQHSQSEKGFSLYAVIHLSDNKLIGYCGFIEQIIDGIIELEIGYRLDPAYWGRGLATEAAAAVREYGLNVLMKKRFVSIIEDANKASVAVAVKNGFKLEKATSFKGIHVGIYSFASGDEES